MYRDHPRLCGEKGTFADALNWAQGSPPPMRGKAEKINLMLFQIRITPAYAGKRKDRGRGIGHIKDHPRLCGEKTPTTRKIPVGIGSPPPMRGKAQQYRIFLVGKRIPPAYAGKRVHLSGLSLRWRDHPRLCGEKDFSAKTSLHDLGSPPPMRGKERELKVLLVEFGITPAYAGKRRG